MVGGGGLGFSKCTGGSVEIFLPAPRTYSGVPNTTQSTWPLYLPFCKKSIVPVVLPEMPRVFYKTNGGGGGVRPLAVLWPLAKTARYFGFVLIMSLV
jgi:hypothetical protein